ncbi:hypothetical protein C8R44DRAFT_123982 [Mycena epipterygia]|nr:hypothetical protein C8R44DRAFT_123982 [Mycena epipterygia]
MPVFDPVRNTVLNSPQPQRSTHRPTTDITTLLSPTDDHSDHLTATPATLKYSPTKRISPPDGILTPMSQEEIEMYKFYRGRGTAFLSKRKRSESESPTEKPDPDQPPAKKIAGG